MLKILYFHSREICDGSSRRISVVSALDLIGCVAVNITRRLDPRAEFCEFFHQAIYSSVLFPDLPLDFSLASFLLLSALLHILNVTRKPLCYTQRISPLNHLQCLAGSQSLCRKIHRWSECLRGRHKVQE